MNNVSLEHYLNELLLVDNYRDYAPNGLQVEGKKDVVNVVCGVTASMELIEVAIARQADAIIAHHGYFWKGETQVITGIKQRRIKALLEHDINLYGYHLPLDGHETLGNNAFLGQVLEIDNACPRAPFDLMWTGDVRELSVSSMAEKITKTLGREPLAISGGDHLIKKIAWCSGGAQGYLEQAAQLGVDAYISGEVSEKTYHEAREYGVHYFASGHHATERGGVQLLAEHLNAHTDLQCEFVDCYNPV